jgi:hypothetical protein
MMTAEARNALLRAHQNNIERCHRLLATPLTERERYYVHQKILEEQAAIDCLLTSFDDPSRGPQTYVTAAAERL